MTILRRSPSTNPVWSLYPPPAETNNLWCDCTSRWLDEGEGNGRVDGVRDEEEGIGGQKMRDGIAEILQE